MRLPEVGDALTTREMEVLQLLKDGYCQELVGDMLGISRQTVKNYGSALLVKLDAPNMVNAVYKAAKAGLI